MLDQATRWMEIAATAVDAVLVVRLLLLKLNRLYLFITLACVLSLFFDIVDIWLRPDVQASTRVFLYTRFLYAFLFPLVAWDVFEEVKTQVAAIRRIAVGRLLSALLFAAVFGFVASFFLEAGDSGESTVVITLGLVLWAGSTTATLAFLWTLHRTIRLQKIDLPNNTFVWLLFWELMLAAEILSCFAIVFVRHLLSTSGGNILDLAFLLYGMLITAWCIIRLRALPSDVPTAPLEANNPN